MIWKISHRADPIARKIADRHYNRQHIGAANFVPPGRCVVLLSTDEKSFWVTSWPFAEFVKHAWAGAWVCSAFRREGGDLLASEMIRQAVAATRSIWPEIPDLGMITFVDTTKTKHKRDPGRCYRRAGFRPVGETKGGLIALQLLPADMPPAEPAIHSSGIVKAWYE
jgi:hypothetical protein